MKKSIVLAEDNIHLRGLYADALRRDGYEVRAVENGQRALESIASKRPNLILLDIMMPKVNGLDACISAREIVGQAIPIIMLTALDDRETVEKGISAGADDYIVKSGGLGILLSRTRYWMTNVTAADLAERRATVLARMKQPEPTVQADAERAASGPPI